MTEPMRRACGHFEIPAIAPGDPKARVRLARFGRKKCRACALLAAAENEARQQAERPVGSPRVKKGQEVKMLPQGCRLTLTHGPDGWAGRLTAGDADVEAVGGGLMGLIQKLARKWLQARGRRLTGRVHD